METTAHHVQRPVIVIHIAIVGVRVVVANLDLVDQIVL